ncbi:MAG: MBOAT family protein [Bacteroidales bacterium]|nr:MBOAT family protein [Bacteroidales bacterium]
MIFNSQEFLIFFSVVVSFFFIIPHKLRRHFILAASYFFYAWWNPLYIFLIIISTLTDFIAGKKIDKTEQKKIRKTWLTLSLIVNIGILFTFKYVNFIAETFNLTQDGGKLLNVLLPVGISFYTFQTISYTIDINRKKIKPENNLINFSLYVAYFPQLVAGPIERAGNIIPQFKQKVKFDAERVSKSLILITLGFFQKVVIADNLAIFVDTVYNNPESYHGLSIAIATIFFAFQIYNDFAGYTNIARGTALIMGIKLSINFRQPYFASSLHDFWKRWHISLSTWFKDYVYISLGGKKLPLPKWALAILITFTISGFWHGANWTFIAWGFLNALVYILETLFRKAKNDKKTSNKIYKTSRIIFTFILINFLWIFFRANSFSDAVLIIGNLATFDFSIPFDTKWLIVCFLLILANILIDFIDSKNEISNWLYTKPLFFRGIIIYFLLMSIFFIGNWHLSPFIYFQF